MQAPAARAHRLANLRFVGAIATGLLLVGADAAMAAPTQARFAYVDPGAGSFLLQALVAMFAGAVVAVNAYWSRIKRFLGLASDKSSGDEKPGSRPDDD